MLNHRYTKEKRIGKGSFGEVFLVNDAKDTTTNKAMKEFQLLSKIDFEKEKDNKKLVEEGIKMSIKLSQETVTLAKLEHPNIVKYFDNFYCDGCYYIIMEYCENGSLENKLLSHKEKGIWITGIQVATWIFDIASALHYLHEKKNIIHRDIKPLNLFITNKERKEHLKLGDFGISNIIENRTLKTTSSTTLAYQSPELLDGEKCNYSSDIWAFGVTLYEICELELPFKKITEVLSKPTPKIRQKDHIEFQCILDKMLKKTSNERCKINDIIAMISKETQTESSTEQKTVEIFPTTIEKAHDDFVWCLVILSDGRLASGSYDYSIKIWDTNNNFTCDKHISNAHDFPVSSLVVLSDGRLASGSYDYSIKIWNNT